MRDFIEGGQQGEIHPLVEVPFRAGHAGQAREEAGADAIGGGSRVILRGFECRPHRVCLVLIPEVARARPADLLCSFQEARLLAQGFCLALTAAQVLLKQRSICGHGDVAAAGRATQRARCDRPGRARHEKGQGRNWDGEDLATQEFPFGWGVTLGEDDKQAFERDCQLLRVRRAEQENGWRGLQLRRGVAARGSFITNDVVAEIGEQSLPEIEAGVGLFGPGIGRVEDQVHRA